MKIIQHDSRKTIEMTLSTILETSNVSLQIWVIEHQIAAAIGARNKEVVNLTLDLLKLDKKKK